MPIYNSNQNDNAAEGFLNLTMVELSSPAKGKVDITEIVGGNGSVVRMPKGIALMSRARVPRTLLAKAKANPDAEFIFVGKVHLIEDDDDDMAF